MTLRGIEGGGKRDPSAEDLDREVLPIESAELALGVNLFAKRAEWLKRLETDARGCVEDMAALAARKPEAGDHFLLLIGAKRPDGSQAEGADVSAAEFLAQAREFLNDIFAAVSARESSGVVPGAGGKWLRTLDSNLYTAIRETGREEDFRAKQDRSLALRKEREAQTEKPPETRRVA